MILDTEVTPELAAEGLARDVVRAVQQARRDASFEVSDQIRVALGGDEEVRAVIETHAGLIATETLALTLEVRDELTGVKADLGGGRSVWVLDLAREG